jgi:hypothetical protein
MLDLDQDPDPNIVYSDPQPFWEKAHQPEFSVQMSSSIRCSQRTFTTRQIISVSLGSVVECATGLRSHVC